MQRSGICKVQSFYLSECLMLWIPCGEVFWFLNNGHCFQYLDERPQNFHSVPLPSPFRPSREASVHLWDMKGLAISFSGPKCRAPHGNLQLPFLRRSHLRWPRLILLLETGSKQIRAKGVRLLKGNRASLREWCYWVAGPGVLRPVSLPSMQNQPHAALPGHYEQRQGGMALCLRA